VTGLWFFPGTLVSSTNKTNCHDIAEILLKVALNTITIIITMFSHIYIFTVDVLVLQRQRMRKVLRHSLQATPQELILKIVSTYGLNSIVHLLESILYMRCYLKELAYQHIFQMLKPGKLENFQVVLKVQIVHKN